MCSKYVQWHSVLVLRLAHRGPASGPSCVTHRSGPSPSPSTPVVPVTCASLRVVPVVVGGHSGCLPACFSIQLHVATSSAPTHYNIPVHAADQPPFGRRHGREEMPRGRGAAAACDTAGSAGRLPAVVGRTYFCEWDMKMGVGVHMCARVWCMCVWYVTCVCVSVSRCVCIMCLRVGVQHVCANVHVCANLCAYPV